MMARGRSLSLVLLLQLAATGAQANDPPAPTASPAVPEAASHAAAADTSAPAAPAKAELTPSAAPAGEAHAAAPAESATKPAEGVATAANSPADADEEIVCVREKPMGSNIYKKVCRTRAQMKAEKEGGQGLSQRAQRATAATPGS